MEGQRVEKKPGRSKKGPLLAGGIAAALLIAYMGLSVWVGMSDKIMPNVSVAGVDVSGMTAEQAQTVLEETIAPEKRTDANWSVNMVLEDHVAVLGGECFRVDAAACAQDALAVGRDNFITQGFQYIRHCLGGSSDIEIETVTLTPGGQEMLETHLNSMDRVAGVQINQNDHQVDLNSGTLTLTKGRTHHAIDREAALAAVTKAFAESMGTGAATVELVTVDQPPKNPDFDAIHQQMYAEVKDAAFDPETRTITDHVVGVDFDVAAAQAAFDAAGEGETVSIPLAVTQPKDTKASLESKLFRDLLGQGTSTVSGTSNRKTNVKLSAAACNGVILLPGEEFSYNNTTGSRSADKGYLPAGVYVGGVSMEEVGGGICQTSSTIYYAVLHTTLEIVERHDHKFAVGYVPDGMDATVYYGSLDFRFRNSTNYPIKIVTESYDSGGVRKLTVKIYGTNEDGRYGVPERTQFEWVEPTTAYLADEAVPQGALVLDKEQNAYTGRKAQTYRYIYEKNGTLVEKQDFGVSKYDMRPHLYHYNPLDGDPATWPNGVPPLPQVTPAPEPTPETGTTEPVVDPTVTPETPEAGGESGAAGETPVQQEPAEETPSV